MWKFEAFGLAKSDPILSRHRDDFSASDLHTARSYSKHDLKHQVLTVHTQYFQLTHLCILFPKGTRFLTISKLCRFVRKLYFTSLKYKKSRQFD